MRRAILALLLLPLAASHGTAEHDTDIVDVSIVQLIANPADWEGRIVRVRGFCHIAFESTGIFLHREDSEIMNLQNGIWLDVKPNSYEMLSEKFAFVVGRFTNKYHGHLGAWAGTIRDVSKLGALTTRRELEQMRKGLSDRP